MHPLWKIEGPSLLWIQVNLRQDWLTPIMQVITRFGDGGIFWIGFCILLLCIPKSRRTGIAASLSLALNGLVTNACLKNIIGRIRPYVRFPELTVLTTIPSDSSFPSGHTAASFAVAAGVYMAGWKKTGVVLYVFSGVIGFSRIYLGVHFPSDVIGGAVVGVLCAWGARKFIDLAGKTQKVQKKGRKRK